MLSASPMARAAVVEAVGARPRGQASARTSTSRCTSAAWARGERALPVSATTGEPSRFTHGTRARISSVSPLFETASSTSPFTIRPRSPWMASAGWRKSEGLPVEASVAEIFCAMIPLLPMPVATTRPVQPRSVSTARSKLSSRRGMSSRIASASISRTLRAVSRDMGPILAAGWRKRVRRSRRQRPGVEPSRRYTARPSPGRRRQGARRGVPGPSQPGGRRDGRTTRPAPVPSSSAARSSGEASP